MIVTIITDDSGVIPFISLIMIAAIYGLQVIIFILKREWQHIGWMVTFILTEGHLHSSNASLHVLATHVQFLEFR